MSEERHCRHEDGEHEEKRHRHDDGGHDESAGFLDSLLGGGSHSASSLQKLFATGGTEFWLGAAVGAAAVALAFNPKVREAVGGLFAKQAAPDDDEEPDEADEDVASSAMPKKTAGAAKAAKAKKKPSSRSRVA